MKIKKEKKKMASKMKENENLLARCKWRLWMKKKCKWKFVFLKNWKNSYWNVVELMKVRRIFLNK